MSSTRIRPMAQPIKGVEPGGGEVYKTGPLIGHFGNI
jgi:hypothetical protein